MARKKTDFIIVHCAATKPSMDIDIKTIDSWHRKRGFFSVGYHYVITRNGTVQIGRKLDVVGGHAKGFNHRSIGICLVGGVSQDDHTIAENNFTNEQWVTLKALLLNLTKKYEIKKIIGHYQVDDKKECPSFKVPEYLEENNLQDYIYIG